jgi:hypothetical protein
VVSFAVVDLRNLHSQASRGEYNYHVIADSTIDVSAVQV